MLHVIPLHLPFVSQDTVRWAMAGPDEDRLEFMKLQLSRDFDYRCKDVPVLRADVTQPGTLDAVAERTKVVINAAGPFTLMGTTVVEACVRQGTHVLDLSGELPVRMVHLLQVLQKPLIQSAPAVETIIMDR